MRNGPVLAPTYLAHAPANLPGGGAQLADELEPLLEELLAAAQEAWPAVPLPPQELVAHLGRHTPPESEPERLLRSLHVEDLFLACACARGLPAALQALEDRYLSRVREWLPQGEAQHDVVSEVQQVLRERLLVGPRPRILNFSGKGTLESWLRTAVRRAALDLHRRHQGAPLDGDDDAALQAAALEAGGDAEMDAMRAQYWPDFKQAVTAALQELPAEQRAVLRLYYIEELTQDAIARMLRVERSTISRWVTQARRAIFDETRRRMQERLGLSADGFLSMLRIVRSQFDKSMARLLRLDGPDAGQPR